MLVNIFLTCRISVFVCMLLKGLSLTISVSQSEAVHCTAFVQTPLGTWRPNQLRKGHFET